MSANLSNIVVGSAPGVNINTKGDAAFELSNDAAKSNGGGSINLLSKIDSSINKKKIKIKILLIHYYMFVLVMKY